MHKKLIALLLAFTALVAVGCGKSEPDQVVIVPEPTIAAPVTTPEAPAEPTPEPTPEPLPAYVSPYTEKLKALQAKNSDCIGWIAIPGTNIDKGIMYADGWYYSSRNEAKEKSTAGSVYAHYNALTQNIVVTAHNSRVSKTMFHELHHVQEVNLGKTNCAYSKCKAELNKATLPDFSTVEGRTWDISAYGIDAQWEIFAMYEVDAKESAKTLIYNTWYPVATDSSGYTFVPKNAAEITEWYEKQISRSQYDFGVSVTPQDQFMTIYTCGDNHDSDDAQSRLYFFLKQVNPVSTLYGGAAQ